MRNKITLAIERFGLRFLYVYYYYFVFEKYQKYSQKLGKGEKKVCAEVMVRVINGSLQSQRHWTPKNLPEEMPETHLE